MRLTELGDLARDLASLAPAMRDVIDPLGRSSRAAATNVRGLNNEVEESTKTTSHAKNAFKLLASTLMAAARNSVAWNDEVQKQVRGTMAAATRGVDSYKARTLALEKEAKAIQSLSGTSQAGAVEIARGINAAYLAVNQNVTKNSEIIQNIGSGLFMDVFKDLNGVRTQFSSKAKEMELTALVSQRMSGMSDTNTAAMFKTAMSDMQLDEGGTNKLFDQIAMATRDFGLSGDKAFQVLNEGMEDIRKQDVKDRGDYARRLLTSAGMIEKASFDFKKYAGSLLAGEGVKGLQDVAMAAAVLGVSQGEFFNLQSRSKANDIDASKSLVTLVETMLRDRAPSFDVGEYRQQQSGKLKLNQDEIPGFFSSQQLATEWLKTIGLDIGTFASLKDKATRIDKLEGSNQSAIDPIMKDGEAGVRSFMNSTHTLAEAINQNSALISQFFDGITSKVATLGQAIGLNVSENDIRDITRNTEAFVGTFGTGIAAAVAGLFGGTIIKRSIASAVTAATTSAAAGGGGAAAAAGTATAGRFAAIGAGRAIPLVGYAIGGIATAMQSDAEKDRDIREAGEQGMLRRGLAGVINPLGQLVLLKRSMDQAEESATSLREADNRLANAQQMEAEVKRVMAESLKAKQTIGPKGVKGQADDGVTREADKAAVSSAEAFQNKALSLLAEVTSLLREQIMVSQYGSVPV